VDVIPSLQRHLSGAYCKALTSSDSSLRKAQELTDEYTSRWEKERTSRARRASQARANRYGLIDEVVNVFF